MWKIPVFSHPQIFVPWNYASCTLQNHNMFSRWITGFFTLDITFCDIVVKVNLQWWWYWAGKYKAHSIPSTTSYGRSFLFIEITMGSILVLLFSILLEVGDRRSYVLMWKTNLMLKRKRWSSNTLKRATD